MKRFAIAAALVVWGSSGIVVAGPQVTPQPQLPSKLPAVTAAPVSASPIPIGAGRTNLPSATVPTTAKPTVAPKPVSAFSNPNQAAAPSIHVSPLPGASQLSPAGAHSPQPGGTSDDDPAAELMKVREQQLKAYGSINSSNPLSADFAGVGNLPKDGPFGKLAGILSNPAVQAYLQFFSNPAFSDGMSKIVQSPNRLNLLYGEVGLFLFMIIFRAWRFAKADHWAKKLWTNLWTFVMGIVLAAALPVVLIDGYLQTLQGLFEYFTKK
jgi:hypothetical protein